MVWSVTTDVATVNPGNKVPINITLTNNTAELPSTFEYNYRFTEGTGVLTDASNTTIVQNKLVEIIPGVYEIDAISTTIGKNEITFDIIDNNGQKKSQVVQFEVSEDVPSNAAEIIGVAINGSNGVFTGNIIKIKLPAGTDLKNLTPTIITSDKATAIPVSNESQDFTNPVVYTITAENGSTKKYTVIVEKEGKLSDSAEILALSINKINGVISDNVVTVTLPQDADLTNLSPVIIVSDSATIFPASNTVQDFSTKRDYRVTAEDGSVTNYVIEVLLEANPLSDDTTIQSFIIPNQIGNTQIDIATKTIRLTVPFGTDVTNLMPSVTVETEASFQPNSVQDFTNPVTYTVTAKNGAQQDWIASIAIAEDTRSPRNDMIGFSLVEQIGPAVINVMDHTIVINVPPETDITSLTPTVAVSPEASYVSAGIQDFTNPVIYTVTAENETSQDWTVTVRFNLVIQPGEAFITTWSSARVIIPTHKSYAYNYNVDWDNDGVLDELGITGEASHIFASAGSHTIQITGIYPGTEFLLAGMADPKSLRSVDQWGTGEWLTLEHAFKDCSNLVINATDVPDFSRVTNMGSMFFFATRAAPDVSQWDTSSVTNMSYMFSRSGISTISTANWNIENVTNMSNMFSGSTLNTASYDNLLIDFSSKVKNDAVIFDGGNANYCDAAAETARLELIEDSGWVVRDLGKKCP